MAYFEWDKFFEDWKKKYNISIFMKDGIVCEEKYENILFILKDVNNAKPDDINDMRISVQTSYDEGKTWFNIARWIAALLDSKSYSELLEIVKCEYLGDWHKFQHEQLKRAAIMNLKKEAGGASVTDATIKQVAKEQIDELIREVVACDPKMIVVCGVGIFEVAKAVLGKVSTISGKRPELEMASQWEIGTIDLNNKTVPIIQFRHPSTGCDAEKSYNDMLKIKKYIKDNKTDKER